MKNLVLFREIYTEAFKGLGSKLTVSFFKIFSLFFVANYVIAIYAIVSKVSVGAL